MIELVVIESFKDVKVNCVNHSGVYDSSRKNL